MPAQYIEPKVRNITRVFRKASAEEVAANVRWYEDAYIVCHAFATEFGLDVEQTIGVVAAMSPNMSWGANVNIAARILSAGGEAHKGYGLLQNVAKANRIIKGEAPLDVLGGDKVRNFYRSILSKGAEGITIDRHAYDIATNTRHGDGDRPTIKGKRYEDFTAAYTRAAQILAAEYGMTLTAGMVQSVTWMVWRSKFWAKGAFDVKPVTA